MGRNWEDRDLQALDWVVRASDPGFADWDTFSAWLEADPQNAARYHALATDVAEVADLQLPAAIPLAAAAQRRFTPQRRSLIVALAAVVVGMVGYGTLQTLPRPYVVETAPGATRTVTLADGSLISLNGGTRLVLDRRNERIATLDHGEALFTIRHDSTRPFKVNTGSNELVDVGTVFDVTRTGGNMRVAVSAGAVIFNPDREGVRLNAGRALRVAEDGGRFRVDTVDPQNVGAWRTRRLAYDGAPLREVAADLSRAIGVEIVAAPDVAARPFRGTIILDGLARDPASIAPLLGVSMRRNNRGWEMTRSP